MKKKIIFITPPYHAGVVESAGRWMPLSFVYLAGIAREEGYEPVIYDAMTKQHTLKEIEETLRNISPDIVAVTSITATLPAALDVLRCAKRIKPDTKTIIGGVHPTFCYEDLFREHGDIIDYIVCGEGELVLKNLLRAWKNGDPLDQVKGIAYVRDGKVIAPSHQPFLTNLDNIPTAWDLLDWEDYRYFVIPDSRLAAVSTSRGCTHGCTFCSQQEFWKRTWRSRSPEAIVKEITYLNSQFGANVFLLTDEYPTLERERWNEFLDRLIFADLGVYVLMETRVEDIVRDADILWKYRKAGIVHIYIGVEATDQATLDVIQKEISVEQSQEAIRLIHAHNMVSETSFVLGFPWETQESIERTLHLAQQYSPDFAHFLAITPWPYAPIYNDVKDSIVVHDYSKYNLVEPIIRPTNMTLEEVRKSIFLCYHKYYMKKAPQYFLIKDDFKREYLKRSLTLIMKNSFLTSMIREYASGINFMGIHSSASPVEEIVEK